MRKLALLYNPVAGRRRRGRLAEVEDAARVFRARGLDTVLLPTESAGSAGPQSLAAIADGCDAIICCGGDGTVHDAAQSLVAARSIVPLGVIPLGTGNALAAELRMSRHPANAAWELLRFEPHRIPVGRLEWTDPAAGAQSRYFLISAGAGADAEMLYRLTAESKRRHGIAAYYAHALRLFWTHQYIPFEVEYRETGSAEPRREIVAQVLAGRIERFGGVVSRLTPGAMLARADLRVVLFRSPRRWPILRHATAATLRRTWRIPQIEMVWATDVSCRPLASEADLPRPWPRGKLAGRVYAQADGELLGKLPVRMSMVPDALTLLMPRT